MPLDSEIVIVSGLPRSGTSLMMQMLDRGGITAMTDQIRTADTDNPHGYFEYERVKKTRQDPSWYMFFAAMLFLAVCRLVPCSRL